jgi:hypothetical protein
MSFKPFFRFLRDGRLTALLGVGAGRLPAEDELVNQLRQAGFSKVKTKNLLPGDRFLAYQAFRG